MEGMAANGKSALLGFLLTLMCTSCSLLLQRHGERADGGDPVDGRSETSTGEPPAVEPDARVDAPSIEPDAAPDAPFDVAHDSDEVARDAARDAALDADADTVADAEEACVAECGERRCGSDGCDGSCGDCESGWTCDEDSWVCVEDRCLLGAAWGAPCYLIGGDCDDGSRCVHFPSLPDTIGFCSTYCGDGSTCEVISSGGSHCVDFGEGSRCVLDCAYDSDCPCGFPCFDVGMSAGLRCHPWL